MTRFFVFSIKWVRYNFPFLRIQINKFDYFESVLLIFGKWRMIFFEKTKTIKKDVMRDQLVICSMIEFNWEPGFLSNAKGRKKREILTKDFLSVGKRKNVWRTFTYRAFILSFTFSVFPPLFFLSHFALEKKSNIVNRIRNLLPKGITCSSNNRWYGFFLTFVFRHFCRSRLLFSYEIF